MIVITGGSGGVGSPLSRLMADAGQRVRVISRSSRGEAAEGVEVLTLDLQEADTHHQVVEGAESIFLNPRAVGLAAPALLRAAGKAGVTKVVVLSADVVDDPDTRQPSRFRGDRNREVEAAVRDSGLAWVALRATPFMSNTLGTIAPQLRTGDVLRTAHPTASFALVDELDIADVAAVTLGVDSHDGQALEVTGPEPLDFDDQLREIAEATRRSLRLTEISEAEARESMTRAGFPDQFASAYLAMLGAASSAPARVSDTVTRMTGRPGRTFGQWVARHADAFTAGGRDGIRVRQLKDRGA